MMEEQIESLRSAMEVLDHQFEELVTPKAMDPEIVHHYNTTVQTYLERKSLETFLNTVAQDPELNHIPEVDTEVLEETIRAKDRLLALVQSIDQGSTVHLKSALASARSKRDAFEHLLMESEIRNGFSVLTQEQVEDEDIDVIAVERRSDELDAEKERLQRRKEELLQQMLVKEREQDQKENEKATLHKEINPDCDQLREVDLNALMSNPEMIEEFEKENQRLVESEGEMKTTQEHFEYMTAIMESLSGVKTLQLNALDGESKGVHLVNFQLLEKYEVEMKTEITVDGRMNVLAASFVPECPLVRSKPDKHGNYMQLTAAPLKLALDSINTIPWKTTEERVNHFFLDTVNMLDALEKRADELFKLSQQSDVLTKIPKVQDDGDHEIVCSMTHLQLSFSLHLTRDCPLSSPSVFLKEFVGFAGWEHETVEHLKTFLHSHDFSSPLGFVEALKAEVSRMEQEEGLTIPATPRFSVQKQHEWD